jgi:mannan endo-1,4-beta-mannosidase
LGFAPREGPIDSDATPETAALFANLQRLAHNHVLFGHQDDLAYGHDWVGEAGRSDVRDVAGSYPAVYGWEMSKIEHDSPADIDGVPFARMRGWILDGYARGAVITMSWHMDNPVSGKDAWDTTRAVEAILPGGARHADYLARLNKFAAFVGTLRAPSGELVPIVFRPFHEMTGAWFWWGAPHATPAEYRALWRFTIDYLRRTKGLHNLLYAYAPNVGGTLGYDHYMDFYPGDDYVDVLGFDEYFWPPGSSAVPPGVEPVSAMTSHLTWLVSQAESRHKIPALTETGYEAIPDSTWWTQRLLAAIKGSPVSRRIAWVLVWRNGNRAIMKRDHFFAPYPGQLSANDFVRFRHDPLLMFESDLPSLYRRTNAGLHDERR